MKFQRRYLLSVLGIMLNNLLFASFYPLAKFMMVQLDAISFMCCAIFLMAAPVGVLLLLWQRKQAASSLLQHGILLGGCFAFLIITQALALNYTSVTETAFFPSLNGLVAATITVCFLKKRVARKVWIAVVFTVVGMCLLVTSSPFSLAHWRGDGIALLSQAGVYTTYIFLVDALMLSKALDRAQTLFMVGVELSAAAAIAATLFLLLGDWHMFGVLSWSDVLVMLYTGNANLVLPVLLFPFVQNGISALSAAFLYLLEPLVAALLAFVFLKERFSPVGYVGMAIVVTGAVIQGLPAWHLGSTRDRFVSMLSLGRFKFAFLVFSTLFLFLLMNTIWLYRENLNTLAQTIEPTCKLGISGTTMTITIQSWSASNDCQQILNGDTSLLGGTVEGQNLFLSAASPQNLSIMCQMPLKGRHLTVSANGPIEMMNMASNECQLLQANST